MGRKGQAWRVILRNTGLFVIATIIFLTLVTTAQWSVTKYQMKDRFVSNLRFIQEEKARFEAEMQKLGMNETEYAWYLTYKQLNIKPTFTGTLEYYARTAFSIFGKSGRGLLGGGFSHSIWYYLRNTVVILLIVELTVIGLGTYLGLKAGYNGGKLDTLVSTLAQLFSAVPVWFIGALVFLLAWRFSIVPDFTMRVQLAVTDTMGKASAYIVGFLLPAITMVLASIWEYAYTLRNIVVGERKSDYITYDRARGLPEGRIRKKLLRVVFPSFLTYTTYNFMDILMSVLVVEVVFDVPGLGYVLLNSFKAINKPPHGVDYYYYPQAIFAVGFFMILLYYINSLLADLLYVYLDPRVRT
ncbi:ABC transporter permease [Thermococcus sp. 21S9]|uniref:ABC transporter permease subunit n=1 Tax=Thermococcus sp. 21S9 TaxID=1638223 RepID=UPI0016A9B09E|nr:ABC transporter permease [Thermococcus sp. 21S9]NJE54525.1 ABC transporter permease [Thermococcus sp. 21S9]